MPNKDQYEYTGKPFQSYKETCKTTGLSVYFLRNGVKDGTVPHIRSGAKVLINIPRLLEQLDALPIVKG